MAVGMTEATEESRAVVRWLDEDEMRAWRGLLRSYAELMGRLDRELQVAHAMTLAEYEVLVRLSEAPGQRMRASDLASMLVLSKSAITRRLDAVVKRGWVRRDPCPEDRRGVYGVLTAEGWEQLNLAAPAHVAGVRRHFIDRLGRRRLMALSEALERVPGPPGKG